MSKSRQYLHNLCICLPFVETEIITLCFVFLSLMFFTRGNLLWIWIWIFQCLFLGTFPFLDTLWFCCDISINLTDFFFMLFSSGKFHWFFTWIQANQMNWKKNEWKLFLQFVENSWRQKKIGCGKTIAKVFSPQCANRTFNIHKNPAIHKVLMP